MGSTVPYGLRFPTAVAVPDVPADMRNLAEDVRDQLLRIDSDVVDLADRVTALEAAAAASRWRHIGSGSSGAGDFSIAVPSGYSRLRLALQGDMAATGLVQIRVNGDDTSGRHISSLLGIDGGGTFDLTSHTGSTGTEWTVAQWATVASNNALIDIWPVNGASNPSFLSMGHRNSTSSTTHNTAIGSGKYNQTVVVSELLIIDSGANFSLCRWWLEGYLDL